MFFFNEIIVNKSMDTFRFFINLLNPDTSIILNIPDREKDFIYGLCHELIEATIVYLIKELGYNPKANLVRFRMPEYFIIPPHLMTIFSLPIYSIIEENISIYESCFKEGN